MSLGERLTFGEVHVVIHADAASTGGALGVMEEVPPARDTPLHVHTSEDELFYALEGELGPDAYAAASQRFGITWL